MKQPLYVRTDAVTSLSDLHDEVAASVARLAGLAPEASSTETSYGTIGSGFTSALGQAVPSRDGALRATSTSSETIRDLLRTAVQMYERGDQEGAARLRAAADALATSEAGGAVGAPAADSWGAPAGAGAAVGGGTETPGQLAGQVGQQVGHLAQSVAQSVQGLVQGLTQLPQQLVQGVQGVMGSAESASATSTSDDPVDDDAKTDEENDGDARGEERAKEQREHRQAASAQADGAQPGRTADAGRAPEPPLVAKPAQPAQTRPQQSAP